MWAAVEARLERLGLALMGWRAGSAAMVGLAFTVLLGGWLLQPGPDPTVTLFGRPVFGVCPVLEATGEPCGQCGTTRSLVWAARGRFGRAARYNPAAFAGWVWIQAAGLVSATRLIRRDPGVGRMPWSILALAGVGWLTLYLGGSWARSAGWNPLPRATVGRSAPPLN